MQVTDEMIDAALSALDVAVYGKDTKEKMRAALTAALSDQERAVEVKALEWVETSINYWKASSAAGRYSVFRISHALGFDLRRDGESLRWYYSTLDEAKAAAQKDFDARIRSALVNVPVEPVAEIVEATTPAVQIICGGRDILCSNYMRSLPVGTKLYASPPLPHPKGEESAEVKYAERLAIALHEKHYSADAPDWKPLRGDLIGLLTQIDNMTAELSLAATRSGSAAGQSDASKGSGE